MKRVSYFGPEYTNTHAAALSMFGQDTTYHPELSKSAVFAAVEEGRADIGVLPIENSTEGVVRETLDGLIERRPLIFREFEADIRHCLMRHPSSGDAAPLRIISHPQPLAQCRRWLLSHYPDTPQESAVSTARAAQIASEHPGTYAIATNLAAQAYGLEIVADEIADTGHNATRFICIAEQDAPPSDRDKTSLVFTARHERGGLLRVLSYFDQAGVNLTRIESRPRGGQKWEYDFVVEVEGHRLRSPVREALAHLDREGCLRKMLGSYHAHGPGGAAPPPSEANP
jgi:chorismate mutase/prephenate dehydratase